LVETMFDIGFVANVEYCLVMLVKTDDSITIYLPVLNKMKFFLFQGAPVSTNDKCGLMKLAHY